MEYLYDRADTAYFDRYAKPRRSFYGKAQIKRTTDERGVVRELYSYGYHVASSVLVEAVEGKPYIIFSIYEPEEYATATTRRHIRAFAQMQEHDASYIPRAESATVVVITYHENDEVDTLCDSEDELHTFRKGQLADLVDEALHSVSQAVWY